MTTACGNWRNLWQNDSSVWLQPFETGGRFYGLVETLNELWTVGVAIGCFAGGSDRRAGRGEESKTVIFHLKL
jgi:hypothetical protein